MRDSCGGLLPRRSEWEDRPALIDAKSGESLSRAHLRRAALRVADSLGQVDRRLVFILADRTTLSLVGFLGAASAGCVVALVDVDLAADKLGPLLDRYRPDVIVAPAAVAGSKMPFSADWRRADDTENLACWRRAPGARDVTPHPDLFLLLATSGTTGAPRFVRLSYGAIASNAKQIALSLEIDQTSVGIAHLPVHYSYGLSVLTSHWASGASVLLVDDGVTSTSFWEAIAKHGGTHFPGVPFHYIALARLGIDRLPESVTTLTQAGGALDLRFQRVAYDFAKARGAKFYVMYGQTEAAPRMTTLPHDDFERKTGSVGRALAGGALSIESEGAIVAPGTVGSVVYNGPNVMLGLAETREDLALPDQMSGRLETGDLGALDDEGFLFLKGRIKRFAKVLGLRISLDQVEKDFGGEHPAYCVDGKEKIFVFFDGPDEAGIASRVKALSAEYKIPSASFSARRLEVIPRTPGGKVDYSKLKEIAGV